MILKPNNVIIASSKVVSMRANRSVPLILIVDDDMTTTRTIEGILKHAGFDTACAYDVAGALAGVRRYLPDLVLLDVSLPDGTGFDVCLRIQAGADTSGTPVLFISSDEDVCTKVQGFEVGGVDYVTKPVAGAEVIARVRTHLRLKSAYEKLAELQARQVEQLALAQGELMPMPEDLPEAQFEVFIHQTLKAGGDFYDVITSGNQVVDYLVADASGHDLAASIWTAALKSLVAEYASPVNSPVDVLLAINRTLRRILPTGAFFTLIYARLNRRTGRLCLVNAAHPPAIIIKNGDPEPKIVSQQGDVLGAFDDAQFGVAELNLNSGDRFFLYSDGLIETGGTHTDGIHRLADLCAARPAILLKRLVASIPEKIIGNRVAGDDTILMGVEI